MYILKHYVLFFTIIQQTAGEVSKGYFEGKCHNIVFPTDDKCRNVTFSDNVHCKLCEQNSEKLTICKNKQFYTSIEDVINNVPDNTTNLAIILDNTWVGYLPLEPASLNLNGLARLSGLKYFQLSPLRLDYYEQFPLIISIETLKNITNLSSLLIRLPIIDNQKVSISEILKYLPSLEHLDLSYTRGLGMISLVDIFQALNSSAVKIKHLCLRKVQLIGGEKYTSNLSYVMHKISNISLPYLEELDMSMNEIARISPGLQNFVPQLKILDVSGNVLVNSHNIAFLVEMILHPNLIILNFDYQGKANNLDKNTIKPNNNNKTTSVVSQDAFIDTINNRTRGLELKQRSYMLYCANTASGGNVTKLMNNRTLFCRFVTTLLPSYFGEINCNSNPIFRSLAEIWKPNCMMYIDVPIGGNLNQIYFSHVHFEQSDIIGVSFKGDLCIKPNSLEYLEMNGNSEWMVSAKLNNVFNRVGRIIGLEKLKRLSLSNNSVSIESLPNLHYKLANMEFLKYLDISGNKINFNSGTVFCKSSPNLQILILANMQISKLPRFIFDNCSKLEYLMLGNNKLTRESLDILNLNGTPKLQLLDLSTNRFRTLGNSFVSKLNSIHSNLTIDLNNNRLLCDCSNEAIYFIKWMNKVRNRLKNWHKYYCSTKLDGYIFVVSIDINTFWNNCHSVDLKLITVVLASIVGFLIVLISLWLIYKVRWRLKYHCFKLRQKYQKCGSFSNSDIESSILWKYDAFISYCAEDRFWVHDNLMKTLEEKYGFRLCIHYRDFPLGGSVAETISQSMLESREIVIVLSDIALKSEWCHFELDEALIQINRRNKRLIVVKLGAINNLLDPKVAHILESHTYLEWSADERHHKLFWATLVGMLYSDPDGGSCCCPYGARSLGYKDIIDTTCSDTSDTGENTLINLPDDLKAVWKEAQQSKTKAEKAIFFVETLKDVLNTDDLPHWAYGPTPLPIHELLNSQEHVFDDKAEQYAKERVHLLIDCLQRCEKKEMDKYNTLSKKIH